MNVKEQLEKESRINHLILVMFYADWSPHNEWLEPTIKEYEQQVEAVIKINITENENLAALYDAEDVPTFILMRKGHQLWKYTGELTPESLRYVLEQYK